MVWAKAGNAKKAKIIENLMMAVVLQAFRLGSRRWLHQGRRREWVAEIQFAGKPLRQPERQNPSQAAFSRLQPADFFAQKIDGG
jgi:hypothetical protein